MAVAVVCLLAEPTLFASTCLLEGWNGALLCARISNTINSSTKESQSHVLKGSYILKMRVSGPIPRDSNSSTLQFVLLIICIWEWPAQGLLFLLQPLRTFLHYVNSPANCLPHTTFYVTFILENLSCNHDLTSCPKLFINGLIKRKH